MLVDLGKENVRFQSSGLVVPRSLIKANPQLAENVAKATVKAAQVKPEVIVDMSYCKKFEDSGFFTSLY